MNSLEATPQIGDILVAAWGYDATWQDFYEVVAVTSTQVKVRELKKERYAASDDEHYDRIAVRPLHGEYKSDEVISRKYKQFTPNAYYIKITPYAMAVLEYDPARTYVESMYC